MHNIFNHENTEGILLVHAANVFNNLNRKAALHNMGFICPALAIVLSNTYQSLLALPPNECMNCFHGHFCMTFCWYQITSGIDTGLLVTTSGWTFTSGITESDVITSVSTFTSGITGSDVITSVVNRKWFLRDKFALGKQLAISQGNAASILVRSEKMTLEVKKSQGDHSRAAWPEKKRRNT